MAHKEHKELIKIVADFAQVEGMLEVPPNAAGIILFAHGSGSSRLSPRNNYVARILRNSGMGTLLMDLLTPQEDQDYRARFDISLLTQRLHTAINWLQQYNITQSLAVGLFGASTGAAAALEVAALSGATVRAVVSRGGRPDLANHDALEKVTPPTLFIVGGLDDVVIQLNQAAYTTLQCTKQLVIIPGATHLFEEPGKLKTVAEHAKDWFLQYLTNPGMCSVKA